MVRAGHHRADSVMRRLKFMRPSKSKPRQTPPGSAKSTKSEQHAPRVAFQDQLGVSGLDISIGRYGSESPGKQSAVAQSKLDETVDGTPQEQQQLGQGGRLDGFVSRQEAREQCCGVQ